MATIRLSQDDDGRTVAARAGDELVIVLPENATTGFRWQLEAAEGILALVSDGYPAEADPATDSERDAEPRFGRGGVREFRFRVTEPGAGRLALKLLQEWEGDSSVTMRFALLVEALAQT